MSTMLGKISLACCAQYVQVYKLMGSHLPIGVHGPFKRLFLGQMKKFVQIQINPHYPP